VRGSPAMVCCCEVVEIKSSPAFAGGVVPVWEFYSVMRIDCGLHHGALRFCLYRAKDGW